MVLKPLLYNRLSTYKRLSIFPISLWKKTLKQDWLTYFDGKLSH